MSVSAPGLVVVAAVGACASACAVLLVTTVCACSVLATGMADFTVVEGAVAVFVAVLVAVTSRSTVLLVDTVSVLAEVAVVDAVTVLAKVAVVDSVAVLAE
ncbi:hypothetical protein FOCC_FOCC017615, partial [Frankliniella occidentalis]